MNDRNTAALLLRAARRANARDQFMGSLLRRFQEMEDYNELQIAEKLGIQASYFPRLALCLRPRRNNFADDVTAISLRFNCDAARLANLIRVVESAEVMQMAETGTRETGLLIAARKRSERCEKDKKDAKDK